MHPAQPEPFCCSAQTPRQNTGIVINRDIMRGIVQHSLQMHSLQFYIYAHKTSCSFIADMKEFLKLIKTWYHICPTIYNPFSQWKFLKNISLLVWTMFLGTILWHKQELFVLKMMWTKTFLQTVGFLSYITNQWVHTPHLPYHKPPAHIVGSTESIILLTVLTEAKENSIYHHLKPNKGTQLNHDSGWLQAKIQNLKSQ
jgi:hypothetical protein